MYRSGAAAQRLLALTPLVQTGIVSIASPDRRPDWTLAALHFTERFASWLSRSSLTPEVLRTVSVRRMSAAPPPPPEAAHQESYLSGSSGTYVEEMYEAWSYDPKSVHASWDAYFRGGAYQSPPTLGTAIILLLGSVKLYILN